MSELTLEQAQMKTIDFMFDCLLRPEPKPGQRMVYDDGYTRLFVTDPPELMDHIARAKSRGPADPKAWAAALSDFATNQAWNADNGRLTHACFDAAVAGDTTQFGLLLTKVLRAAIVETAEQAARNEWNEEHDV